MTERQAKKKIKRLLAIERARLPYLKNWSKVNVYREGDTMIHYWHGTKCGYDFHRIERPISKIDYYIQYHNRKLKNKS